jgi:outer membrane protein OmpA-like peptidoglycan-associated protein
MMALLASLAFGQDAAAPLDYPIDIERFHPIADLYGYAITESCTTLRNLQVGTGMWGNFASDPLVLYWDGQRVLGPPPDHPDGLVDRRTTTDFQAGFGLANFFSLTVDAPVVVWQEGFEPAAQSSPVATSELNSAGLGDIRVHPKFVLADIRGHDFPVGAALSADVSLPTGSSRSFIGDGELSVTPLVTFEAADGNIRKHEYRVRAAINAGGHFKRADAFRDLALGSEFVYRAALAAHPTGIFELGGDLGGAVSGDRIAQTPLEILPWVRIYPSFVQLTAGAGFGLVPGVGSPDYRFFFGATLGPNFDPLRLDRDGDGIANERDGCVNLPEDKDGFEDEDGCPEDDNDQDGLRDDVDRCPLDPEDRDGDRDDDGCPEAPGDSDRDGLGDDVDQCPYDPEDADGFQDADGCPDLDNDRDAVLDVVDQCPNAPETVNGYLDQDGCPDAATRVVVEKEKIAITEKIFLEYDKAIIQDISFVLLNEIASVMNQHPEVVKIQIEGHTDGDGSAAYNQKLSQARAEAVMAYLINAGVSGSRLTAVGYGEDRPIDTNATPEGKAQNRRVDFTILAREE